MTTAAFQIGETRRQLLRYGVTGLISNSALYGAYLLLSWIGIGHKLAMTMTYCTGVLCTFVFNRRWTFGDDGAVPLALLRYVTIYACGYVFNALALLALVDSAGLPHQWVMLALIIASAAIIFLLQKFWVFTNGHRLAPG